MVPNTKSGISAKQCTTISVSMVDLPVARFPNVPINFILSNQFKANGHLHPEPIEKKIC